MEARHSQPWIPIEKIENMVQLEPALVILGLSLGAWLCYKILLKEVSEERHKNLKGLFRNLLFHAGFGTGLFLAYYGLHHLEDPSPATERVTSYVGLLTLLSGATAFVKVSKILVFEYLFLSHMKVAVPLILVNLFTLLLTLGLCTWGVAEIFNIKLTPILATSAIFSLVLGLALQDTLGNLFAGIALQFDRPYEIGDWIEIQGTNQKWIGQVHEISWRATVLLGLNDESITVPNRVMAQTQISNFSTKSHPIYRSQVFKIPFEASIDQVKEILVQVGRKANGVRKTPSPIAIISEAADSWIGVKLVYCIDNYGAQHLIADQVLSLGIAELNTNGIQLANPRLTVTSKIESA